MKHASVLPLSTKKIIPIGYYPTLFYCITIEIESSFEIIITKNNMTFQCRARTFITHCKIIITNFITTTNEHKHKDKQNTANINARGIFNT